MVANNGKLDDDEMGAAESAKLSADLSESVGDGIRRPPRADADDPYHRAVSGMYRDGRALGMSGPSIRRSSKNKSREKIRRLRVIVAALLVGFVFAAGTAILSWNQERALNARVFALDSELRTMAGELQEAREVIALQEAELRSLISGRLPDLTALQLDAQIELNQEYLHSLTFMKSGVGDNKQLEYHAILKNTGTAPVVPQVSITLFDNKGIQTGVTRIDTNVDSQKTPAVLEPGETRSYTSVLEMLPDTEYAYFLVELN